MPLLVATDFSPAARAVVDVAAQLALQRRERLLVVHVVEGPTLPAHHDHVAAEERRLQGCGCPLELLLEPGPPVAEGVARVAERCDASLVVVGAQGAGARALLGTSATALLRRTHAPLLVVRQADRLVPMLHNKGARALFCVALDDTDAGLPAALELLSSFGPVTAFAGHDHLVPERGAARKRDAHTAEAAAALRAVLGAEAAGGRRGVTVEPVIRDCFGRIDAHLVELASERSVDVIVVGSHRRQGLDRIREGSVAEGIVKQAPVSVLVAPGG